VPVTPHGHLHTIGGASEERANELSLQFIAFRKTFNGKVSLCITKEHIMKAYMEVEVLIHAFFASALRGVK
jgi:hypothetical protein